MHTESIERWMHDHTFGQDEKKSAEHRTLIVIVITVVTMAVEIAAGIVFGSMALLADGLHMGSHASALAISAFAYYYTRRHAKDARFNFGTGKVSSLAGFASAVVLVLFALVMAWESIARLLSPVAIGFDQAIFVAVLGLIVNGICLLILGGHGHSYGQSSREDDGGAHDGHEHKHPDHNFRSAYLHVLADALTSVLAIFALLAGKYLKQGWLDPFMGIIGAALVVRWSWGLLRSSARVLLDMRAPEELREGIRKAVESEGDNRISDMHVWSVGPGLYAAEIAVVSSRRLETPGYYDLLPKNLGIVHITVETHQCASPAWKAP
jgi:cation diffusion facilitator family transporter